MKRDARGGLACLAQTRQNRPGIGELDLTNIFCNVRATFMVAQGHG
jgi:hypothetical protein